MNSRVLSSIVGLILSVFVILIDLGKLLNTSNTFVVVAAVTKLKSGPPSDAVSNSTRLVKLNEPPVVCHGSSSPIPLFYIYIDPVDKHSSVLPPHVNALLADINRLLQHRVEVHVYTYNSLLPLVQRFDAQLGKYFEMLNPKYGAMLANIGRAVLLHEHGGIYHDIRSRMASARSLDAFISTCAMPHNYSLIFEMNPEHRGRIQLTNMVGCRKHSRLLQGYLQAITTELNRVFVAHDTTPYTYFGTQILLDIIQSFAECQTIELSAPQSTTQAGMEATAMGKYAALKAKAKTKAAAERAAAMAGRGLISEQQQQQQQRLQQLQEGRRLLRHKEGAVSAAASASASMSSEYRYGGEWFVSSNFELVQYDTEYTYHEEPVRMVMPEHAAEPLLIFPQIQYHQLKPHVQPVRPGQHPTH